MADLTEVPAVVIEADDKKTMELALIENLQREDLNPVEEALGYQSLMENYAMTQEQAAERVGKSRPAVANALRLLNLTPEVLEMVQNGKLSAGHARAVLSLKDPKKQIQAAQRIAALGLSVRQAEQLAKKLAAGGKRSSQPREDAQVALYLADLEKNLSGRMGRKVHIVHGRKKGRIELEYYDEPGREDRQRQAEGQI